MMNIIISDNPDYEDIMNSFLDKLKTLDVQRKPKRNFYELAVKLIDIYKEHGCIGSKNTGKSSKPWTGSPQIIERRLMSDKIDLSTYSDEQIVNATKNYIDVIDKTYKRTLLYFIWKEEGGFHSDLLDYLAMEESGESKEDDTNWLYTR